MLHTGMIGGHHKGKQAAALLESCKSRLVEYIDPTRTNEAFKALRVAKLEKDEFVNGLESFVKDIRKFKEGIDESVLARIPPSTLKKEIDGYVTKPRSVQVVSVAFKRNQYVAEVVRRRAKGKCELCRKSAPFKKTNGIPYLECHHIVWLSRGGVDTPENTVALCPNCHRKMHIVNCSNDVRTLVGTAQKKYRGL